MDLMELFDQIKKQKIQLFICICLGVILGGIIYALPKKYIVEGDFFVGRQVEPSGEFFTYEGYYSQTNAALFADTFVALTESNDIKKELLEKLGMPVNSTNIKKVSKYIKTKRPGAHLANLTIRNYDKDKALIMWNTMSEILISKTQALTKQSDPNLRISKVSETPLLRRDDHILMVDVVLGGIVGGAVFGGYTFIKINFKKTNES